MASKNYWIECIDKNTSDYHDKFIEEFDTLEDIKEWLINNPNFFVIDTTLKVFAYLDKIKESHY